jgi:hypothetical protein
MSDEGFSIRPAAGTTYYVGGPDLKGGKLPQQGGINAGLEMEVGDSDEVTLKLNGEVLVDYYHGFRGLQLLNPQFPTITSHGNGQDAVLTRGRLSEAQVIYYGSRASFSLGYQKAVFGQTEFPLAPANTFSGTDFESANQIPTYRSVLGLQGKIYFGSHLSLFLAATPSSETRNIMPFQLGRLTDGLPVGVLKFVNQSRMADADGLLGFKGSWKKWSLLLTGSREHDHFFKIGGGELDPQNNSATLNGRYPSRETAAAEVGGTRGNLVYWLQGNFAYYDHFQNGSLSSPLGDIPLNYSRYSYQGALGARHDFPEQFAYLAAQGFYGSLTGNGELNQAVASASGGIQFLNGDLKLGALFNSYFETSRPKLESFINLTYQPVPGLEFSLGGRLAQTGIFSLAQPWYGYFSVQYRYIKPIKQEE